MKLFWHFLFVVTVGISPAAPSLSQDDFAVALPNGVRAVWDLSLADRKSTPTRESICLNGLWHWRPSEDQSALVPTNHWGYFKVPGCWPGISDYLQKDCQTLFAHPAWSAEKLNEIAVAWYQREFEVPPTWNGRRITLSLEYLNSFAIVWIDGQRSGEISFPGGEADLTAVCRPGTKHNLSLLVAALPLKEVMLSHADTFGARQVSARVERRGLCGDVYLVGTPTRERLGSIRVSTSVRNWELGLQAQLHELDEKAVYSLRARITQHGRTVKEFAGQPFSAANLESGSMMFKASWKPDKLWDTVTPQNMYEVELSLLNSHGQLLDASLPQPFGFRELWIQGRDFYLNGSRIFLCAVPLDNAQVGAAWATYPAARESFQRLKSFGINFVYTHNYGCEPGSHLGFSEILRAADDEGMLVSFSQPHFSQYDWKAPEADRTNGYARHAEFYVRMAQNHPSVVFYSMSHNATGTEEEMNPDLIDGLQDRRNQWSANGAKSALRAEAIVRALDPSRIVYHHSSGNLGSMHTANFYANFAPIQEMSDWLEHWATVGVKPLFLCEYGVPIFWDWMMYRGWYKGVRTFGSAQVPWEFCLAEWDAQFLGDQAFKLTDLEKDCLRWEARQFRAGRTWHRWDYPRNAIESVDFEQRNEVLAMYLTDNVRAFRTWGISAVCPWDHGVFWKLREGARHGRQELPVDWEHLQRPGFSPDYIESQMEWMNLSYERTDWLPTVAGRALIRNNQPLLAYLGGKPGAFTAKDHNFYPGETVEKQFILINNSRKTVTGDCSWVSPWSKTSSGHKRLTVQTGEQARLPLSFHIPANAKSGRYELRASVHFSTGETQDDTFAVDVLPQPAALRPALKTALFDPKGETEQLLTRLGVQFSRVSSDADLSAYNLLVVGKGALKPDAPAPNITAVREGLKVLLFEQTADVLQDRFGFRVEEYGLRNVFKRIPDHPLLAGMGADDLRDWRGSATLLPERLHYEIGARHAPEVEWCGIPVTRLWRAGNRGNVASVLIEKPARGDFLPILDGGFSLQFSPLLEYREGQGLVLFCQLDVTGRTEPDPAADIITRHLFEYVSAWKPAPRRKLLYAGGAAGMTHLEKAGFSPAQYRGGPLPADSLLVLGAGSGNVLSPPSLAVGQFLQAGGSLLAIGLDTNEAKASLPFNVQLTEREHIGAYFEPSSKDSSLAGVGPADVHNRDPRVLPLVSGGATVIGDGVLAEVAGAKLVFCQIAPYDFLPPQAASEPTNLRRTYRRTSFLLTRLLANMGVASSTPLLERFQHSVNLNPPETRWLEGFYLDTPQEWDDPYRFFCW